MSFTWADGAAGGTPLNAANLNALEGRIEARVAQVVYAGDLGATRPTADVVLWINFPAPPTNAQDTDLEITSGAVGATFDSKSRAVPFGSPGDMVISSATWADVETSLDLTVAVSAGDRVAIYLNGKWKGGESNTGYLNVLSVNRSGHVTDAANGVTGWQGPANLELPVGATVFYVIQAADISGGTATFRLQGKSSNTRTLKGTSSDPTTFSAQVV